MNKISAPIDLTEIRSKLLHFSKLFDTCFFYDSNTEQNPALPMSHRSYDLLLALGKKQLIDFSNRNVFDTIDSFQRANKTWIFGYLSYDLKNEIETLVSANDDALQLPEAQFIEPQIIITVKGNEINISTLDNQYDPNIIYKQLLSITPMPAAVLLSSTITSKTSEANYINAFKSLQREIAYGNIYEINYCIAFNAEIHHQHYEQLYLNLNEISKAPFSAFVKVNQTIIICASPERFIKKQGQKIFSQPIKGTAKRGLTDNEDEQLKRNLFNNEKERSENVMITDLVRNDLSKHAARNSVKVDELFGIYSFKQVHQMISTVSATLNDENNFIKAIKDAFPMGSMTGAPKIMAMKLIEQHEQMKRGLYSGALGYIDSNNDYDFNVLIRSVIINKEINKAQFCVGSAITAQANAEDEYQECLLKANALFKVLS